MCASAITNPTSVCETHALNNHCATAAAASFGDIGTAIHTHAYTRNPYRLLVLVRIEGGAVMNPMFNRKPTSFHQYTQTRARTCRIQWTTATSMNFDALRTTTHNLLACLGILVYSGHAHTQASKAFSSNENYECMCFVQRV